MYIGFPTNNDRIENLIEFEANAREREEASQARARAEEDRVGTLSQTVLFKLIIAKKRFDVIDWLTSSDVHAKHLKIQTERTENTGSWFIEKLQPWIQGDQQAIVHCHGLRLFP